MILFACAAKYGLSAREVGKLTLRQLLVLMTEGKQDAQELTLDDVREHLAWMKAKREGLEPSPRSPAGGPDDDAAPSDLFRPRAVTLLERRIFGIA